MLGLTLCASDMWNGMTVCPVSNHGATAQPICACACAGVHGLVLPEAAGHEGGAHPGDAQGACAARATGLFLSGSQAFGLNVLVSSLSSTRVATALCEAAVRAATVLLCWTLVGGLKRRSILCYQTVGRQLKLLINARQGASGDNEWERAISLIDFSFTRPNGSDLARQRGVLFSAKAKHQSSANGGSLISRIFPGSS